MYRFILAALLLFVCAAPASAQFSTGESLSLVISPENPRPYETVTVTPSSNVINLIASSVTMSVNGKVVEQGTGAQSVPVVVAGPGERTTISVTATSGGKSYTKSVTLRPADVALVIEPISTTHPMYRGAALTSSKGRVRIIALPDLRLTSGSRIASADLIYTWRLGDQVLQGSSGIGRSVLIAEAPVRYRDAQVSVTVTSADGTLVAESAAVVSPADQVSRIYRNDPLMGPDFDHALSGSYSMSSEEEAFRGVAYFFGTAPSLSWAVNGQSASSDNDVTVRTTGTGQGIASLSLTAKNEAALQTALSRLSISFGAKQPNIFGF